MKKMLLILSIIVFCLANVSLAEQTIKLQWDTNDPAPDGYRIFQRLQSDADYNYSNPIWEGTDTITNNIILQNGNYAFVARAFIGDNESANSNELLITIDDQAPPVVIPGRPKTLTIIFE